MREDVLDDRYVVGEGAGRGGVVNIESGIVVDGSLAEEDAILYDDEG